MSERPRKIESSGGGDAEAAMEAAAAAQATANNARQMVLNRDPRLKSLEDVADRFQVITAAAEAEHERLQSEIDNKAITPGPAGPAGPQGAKGDAGSVGATGAVGPQGAAGPKGDAGATGAQGPKGDTGNTGPAGPQGAKGDQGAQGPQGLKGDTGSQGATGAQGPQGPAGVNALTQIEYRDGISVPAVLSLLGISATVDVTVTWATPFPDANYIIVKPSTTSNQAALIGKTDAVVKSKTAAGCVVTVTTTALLAVGNVTLSVLAYRKQ